MKVLILTADFCKPSQIMLPMLKEVLEENGIEMVHHDISKDADIGLKYNVIGTPTTIILDEDGTPSRTMVGMKNKGSLKGFLGLL